jgi:hypothetical protein
VAAQAAVGERPVSKEHIWPGKDVEAENDRAELSRLRRRKTASDMSLVCLSEKHDECKRKGCACWCHGGVREPRSDRPTPVSGVGRETP